MKPQYLLLATTTILQLLISNSISAFPTDFLPFHNTTSHRHDFDPSNLPPFTSPIWKSFQNLSGCHLGDQLEGLAKLKQYFNRFGYIPTDSNSNYTDHFDDSLESALKTYQKNFNLNATGVLDDTTLKQIVRPRCGNADIINGSSSMNSGKSDHSNHVHTVAHYSFFPGTPRWSPRNRELSYAFAPENRLTDSVKAVFSRAFARWSEVTPLTFREISSYYAADITIGFFSGNHGDGEPFDGELRTLAHAFSPPNGRFHLDADENWVTDAGDASTLSLTGYSDAVDLESVAVHEIGHLLGLGHSSVEESIMFPTISSGKKKVELAGDDVEGIQSLYGGNPNYNGTTTFPTQSSQDTDSGFFSGVDRMRINTLEIGILVVLAGLFLL